MEPLTFSALSAHKLGIFMPPSRHPMKKHICSCCTIELVNTGTWNIRNPRKSSFAKMFRNLLGAKQVESGFSSPLAALTFLLLLLPLPRHAFGRSRRRYSSKLDQRHSRRATLKKKTRTTRSTNSKRDGNVHCLL